MKIRFLLGIAMIGALTLSLTSCSDDDDPSTPIGSSIPNLPETEFDADGVWNGTTTETPDGIDVEGINYTRSYDSQYNSHSGFTPSRNFEMNYETNYWPDHQWGVIVLDESGDPVVGDYCFMTAYWQGYAETLDEIPTDPVCRMRLSGNGTFRPINIEVANSTVAYNCMKYGLGVATAFDESSWFKLYIVGVKNGVKTGTVTVDLAKGTDILTTWETVNLEQLGWVEYIYFQMDSSDSGQWGVNTATYFCTRGIRFEYNR